MLNYKSKEAANYFSKNRLEIKDFYESEKFILNKFIKEIEKELKIHTILDVGCAAGGLGNGLRNILQNKIRYIGIDINPLSINAGKELNNDIELIEGDFSKKINLLSKEKIDTVISFSCIDWNENFDQSLDSIFNFCKNNNCDFIFTFRSSQKGINDISQSYQFVNYNNEQKGEIANYVVLSYEKIISILNKFNPKDILISAYKGKPSDVAITPYSELIFGCIWLKDCFKSKKNHETTIEGKFPLEIFI